MSAPGRVFLLAAVAVSGTAGAQYREGVQPVVAPAFTPAPQPEADVATEFAEAYRRSGQPRIVLLWNREFDDRTQLGVVDKQVTRETGKASGSSIERATQGGAGSATSKESDESHDRSRSVTSGRYVIEEQGRRATLAERHAAALQRAFISEMGRGGLRFIDRALIVRTTAAATHRGGGDAKLIETDALLKHGDLLMEVLMVEDKDTPAGYGFDVRAKDLRAGHELASLYSRAIPPRPPSSPPTWVAGEKGYVLRPAAAPASPSPADVGAALARDVMLALAGRLDGVATPQRSKP